MESSVALRGLAGMCGSGVCVFFVNDGRVGRVHMGSLLVRSCQVVCKLARHVAPRRFLT